jgi:phage-related protein
MRTKQVREVLTYGDYFAGFYQKLDKKTRLKVDWTINLLESFEVVPAKYFKHLKGTDGLYEIRVEYNSNIFRILCFFDEGKLVVVTNGFQKKTQRTPITEIERALRLKKQYFDEKE